MQISCSYWMGFRELPGDFALRCDSAWFTSPCDEVADRWKLAQHCKPRLDDPLHAAEVGFDGVCTNERQQDACAFTVNPT